MLPSRASDSSKHDERVLCRNERKVESFPDLGEDELSCEERGGLLWVLWVLYGGCMGQRGDECRIS